MSFDNRYVSIFDFDGDGLSDSVYITENDVSILVMQVKKKRLDSRSLNAVLKKRISGGEIRFIFEFGKLNSWSLVTKEFRAIPRLQFMEKIQIGSDCGKSAISSLFDKKKWRKLTSNIESSVEASDWLENLGQSCRAISSELGSSLQKVFNLNVDSAISDNSLLNCMMESANFVTVEAIQEFVRLSLTKKIVGEPLKMECFEEKDNCGRSRLDTEKKKLWIPISKNCSINPESLYSNFVQHELLHLLDPGLSEEQVVKFLEVCYENPKKLAELQNNLDNRHRGELITAIPIPAAEAKAVEVAAQKVATNLGEAFGTGDGAPSGKFVAAANYALATASPGMGPLPVGAPYVAAITTAASKILDAGAGALAALATAGAKTFPELRGVASSPQNFPRASASFAAGAGTSTRAPVVDQPPAAEQRSPASASGEGSTPQPESNPSSPSGTFANDGEVGNNSTAAASRPSSAGPRSSPLSKNSLGPKSSAPNQRPELKTMANSSQRQREKIKGDLNGKPIEEVKSYLEENKKLLIDNGVYLLIGSEKPGLQSVDGAKLMFIEVNGVLQLEWEAEN